MNFGSSKYDRVSVRDEWGQGQDSTSQLRALTGINYVCQVPICKHDQLSRFWQKATGRGAYKFMRASSCLDDQGPA